MTKNTTKTGKDYEQFVADIYQSILAAEKLNRNAAHIQLERDKLITGKSGATAQVDIYWEYEIADALFKVAIECKDYKSRVWHNQLLLLISSLCH